MNVFQYIAAEWNKLKQNKGLMLSVIIILFVPFVYAMIILSPKWGPYDNLDNVPVAVVNNDKGAMSDGESINVGNELIENLQANPTLDWDFVSDEAADKGMEQQKYYMKIEVPDDFSTKAITVMDDNPEMPQLSYTQNEGLHFMASQVTENAIETIQNELETQVTETYVDNVFSQLGEVADGFTEASDGSEELEDGIGQLKDGSNEILSSLIGKSDDIDTLAEGATMLEDGAGELNDTVAAKQPDIAKLADGSRELNAGTNELLTNLNEKSADISELASGAVEVNDGTGLLLETLQEKSSDIKELSEGANELNVGTNELKDGSEELLAGLNTASNGSNELKNGLSEQLTPGSIELADGVVQAQEGVNETIESMEGLRTALEKLPNSEPGLEDNKLYQIIMSTLNESLEEAPQKQEDFQELVNGANAIKDGLSEEGEFYQGVLAIDGGLNELVNGQAELNEGIIDLSDGANQIAEGNETVEEGWNELEVNVSQLHDGTTQIKDGNQSVATGWNELQEGATALHDGSSELSEGNQTVKQGWDDLVDGTSELYDGSSELSEGNQTVRTGWTTLTDGVQQVDDGLLDAQSGSTELASGLLDGKEKTSDINPGEENKTMFAAPVQIDGEVINSFSFYRDSNVPYIMTLALFVGVLALSFVIPFRKPAVLPANGVTWLTGKLSIMISFSILQALIISLFALVFLKIEVQSNIAFVLFSVFVSIVSLMIVMFLIALAGNVGKFIAFIFVVLQLATTGSDLPIDMLPEGLRQLSIFLPFTYAIDGFKQIVTLGSMSNVWKDVAILSMYLIGTLALAFGIFTIRHKYISEDEIKSESFEDNAI